MKLFGVINGTTIDDTKCCCIAVAAVSARRGRCGGRTFQTIYFPATANGIATSGSDGAAAAYLQCRWLTIQPLQRLLLGHSLQQSRQQLKFLLGLLAKRFQQRKLCLLITLYALIGVRDFPLQSLLQILL